MAADTPEKNPKKLDPRDYVAWLKFDDDSAVMKRVILPGNGRALLLHIRNAEQVERVSNAAQGLGFVPLRNPERLRIILKDGKPPFSMREAAQRMGATAFALSSSDIALYSALFVSLPSSL